MTPQTTSPTLENSDTTGQSIMPQSEITIEPNPQATLARQAKFLRQTTTLSQRDIANELGISASLVNKFLNQDKPKNQNNIPVIRGYYKNEGIEKYMFELDNLKGKDFLHEYPRLLEYFIPRNGRKRITTPQVQTQLKVEPLSFHQAWELKYGHKYTPSSSFSIALPPNSTI